MEMRINNIDFISKSHEGLIVSDITSAAFIEDLPWKDLIYQFFHGEALGSESQHGVIVMSPKSPKDKKKKLPKILSIYEHEYVVNTPSLLSISDLNLCLDIFKKRWNKK